MAFQERRYLFGRLLCCLALITASFPSCTAYDFAKWTFDSHNEMTVTPEDKSDSNFVGDLTPLGSDISSILVPGVHNKSLYVNGKSFNLATDLGSTCMRDFTACGDSEWGFSFWLKIVDWNNAKDPVIFRTTNLERTDAGIYVGRGEDDTVMVFLRGSAGFSISTSFSQTPLWNQWGHVTITTSRRPATLKVRVNGTRYGGKISISTTTRGIELMPADFVVGAENGPTFYLDDLNIQYHDSLTTSSATTTSSTATTTTTTTMTTRPTTTTTTTTSTTTTEKPTTSAITEPVATSTMTNAATESTNTNIIVPPNSSSNIWIPIVIAIIVALLILGCLLWILCVRRRKSRRDMESEVGVRFTDVQLQSGYARTSTIVPYHDVDSNQDTEDSQTDQEEQGGQLLPVKASS